MDVVPLKIQIQPLPASEPERAIVADQVVGAGSVDTVFEQSQVKLTGHGVRQAEVVAVNETTGEYTVRVIDPDSEVMGAELPNVKIAQVHLGKDMGGGIHTNNTIAGDGSVSNPLRAVIGQTAGTVAAGNDPRFGQSGVVANAPITGNGTSGSPLGVAISTAAPVTGNGTPGSPLGVSVGTTAGTVAAGDDPRFGSGSVVVNAPITGNGTASSPLSVTVGQTEGTVAAGNDPRFNVSQTLQHAYTHTARTGYDPLSPFYLNAVPANPANPANTPGTSNVEAPRAPGSSAQLSNQPGRWACWVSAGGADHEGELFLQWPNVADSYLGVLARRPFATIAGAQNRLAQYTHQNVPIIYINGAIQERIPELSCSLCGVMPSWMSSGYAVPTLTEPLGIGSFFGLLPPLYNEYRPIDLAEAKTLSLTRLVLGPTTGGRGVNEPRLLISNRAVTIGELKFGYETNTSNRDRPYISLINGARCFAVGDVTFNVLSTYGTIYGSKCAIYASGGSFFNFSNADQNGGYGTDSFFKYESGTSFLDATIILSDMSSGVLGTIRQEVVSEPAGPIGGVPYRLSGGSRLYCKNPGLLGTMQGVVSSSSSFFSN